MRYNLIPDLAPEYPLLLAKEIGGADDLQVSPPIPFAFCLDRLTIWAGPSVDATPKWFQLYISDDADPGTTPRPTGDPVILAGPGSFVTEPQIPLFFINEPIVLEPGILVLTPGRRIKLHWRTAGTGHDYHVLCNLIPLDLAA